MTFFQQISGKNSESENHKILKKSVFGVDIKL